jgi:hypothetical protein
MALSWQQGPLGRDPNGRFLTASPIPERLLFAEPLRRRMSVELGGSIVARADVVSEALHPAEGQTFCPYKGLASYYDIGDTQRSRGHPIHGAHVGMSSVDAAGTGLPQGTERRDSR